MEPSAAAASVAAAEEALHAGRWLAARAVAAEVLAAPGTAGEDLTRAFYVLLQVDFQTGRLTDIEESARFHGRALGALPAPVMLLWGVIALEMEAGAAARDVLGRYIAAAQTAAGSSLSPGDSLALSRLYAIRVVAEAGSDAAGAREWLRGGGAGLSQDQERILLSELDALDALKAAQGPTTAAVAANGSGDGAAAPSSGGNLPNGAAAGANGEVCVAAGGPGNPFFTMTGGFDEIEEFESGDPAVAAGRAAGHGAAGPSGRGGGREGEEAAGGDGGGAWGWAREAAARGWECQAVQDTLRALHLEDVPPWQLAGGAAAAALVAFSLYRERKSLRRGARRAAAGAAAGLAQIAAMATGFHPDAMAAAPRPA